MVIELKFWATDLLKIMKTFQTWVGSDFSFFLFFFSYDSNDLKGHHPQPSTMVNNLLKKKKNPNLLLKVTYTIVLGIENKCPMHARRRKEKHLQNFKFCSLVWNLLIGENE